MAIIMEDKSVGTGLFNKLFERWYPLPVEISGLLSAKNMNNPWFHGSDSSAGTLILVRFETETDNQGASADSSPLRDTQPTNPCIDMYRFPRTRAGAKSPRQMTISQVIDTVVTQICRLAERPCQGYVRIASLKIDDGLSSSGNEVGGTRMG
jgi:hypothetical protein